jgi:hypothetical protein
MLLIMTGIPVGFKINFLVSGTIAPCPYLPGSML